MDDPNLSSLVLPFQAQVMPSGRTLTFEEAAKRLGTGGVRIQLSHRMARPSMDYCKNGKLAFFEDSTHWVQHEESEAVNRLLVEFCMEK